MSLSQISDDKTPLFPAAPFLAEADWNSSDVPEDGALVEVYAEDRRGFYLVPFPVCFVADEWRNAATGQELETFIAGWRPWRGRA
ncbi:hypothetical protein [Methylosinus sp. LW4]|uniref:hypothetical protein n=1 Tax=Methylosinus sp. LW4 TaxID=136993 RepID=UPI00037684EF|nr:hypothetical protein [Methylosinus sp. LW4]